MFAVVVAGRLPLTTPQQIDPTHIVFPLEEANSINHVTVFMDGSQAFPPGYSAIVHFLWPGEGKEWMLLGCLRNAKPSAIFKLRGTAIPSSSSSAGATPGGSDSLFASGGVGQSTSEGVTAQLGISIELDEVVDAQMAALAHATGGAAGAAGAGPADASAASANAGALVKAGERDATLLIEAALAVAPRIAKNAFSYLSSFAPDSAPQTAPLLQKWLEQFERKLKAQGAAFLEKDV